MICTRVKAQYIYFLRRELDQAERQIIEAHLVECDDCRLALQEIESMWTGLDALPERAPSAQLRERFFDALHNANTVRATGMSGKSAWTYLLRPQWVLAFTMVILLGGFLIGRLFPAAAPAGNTPQLAQIQKDVSDLRGLMALTLLSQDSVQARLRGIEYARKSGSGDPRVLTLLLNTVDRDETRNVRLAALDVLGSHLDNSMVRERIYNRLLMEPSPLVQLKIVELLLEGAGDGGHELLDDLLKTGILEPTVAGFLRQVEAGGTRTVAGQPL